MSNNPWPFVVVALLSLGFLAKSMAQQNPNTAISSDRDSAGARFADFTEPDFGPIPARSQPQTNAPQITPRNGTLPAWETVTDESFDSSLETSRRSIFGRDDEVPIEAPKAQLSADITGTAPADSGRGLGESAATPGSPQRSPVVPHSPRAQLREPLYARTAFTDDQSGIDGPHSARARHPFGGQAAGNGRGAFRDRDSSYGRDSSFAASGGRRAVDDRYGYEVAQADFGAINTREDRADSTRIRNDEGFRARGRSGGGPYDDGLNQPLNVDPPASRNREVFTTPTARLIDDPPPYGLRANQSLQQSTRRGISGTGRDPEAGVPAGRNMGTANKTAKPVVSLSDASGAANDGTNAGSSNGTSAAGGVDVTDGDSSDLAVSPRLPFWPTVALFASLAANLFFGWIAWDTHARYQDFVAEMSESESRTERQSRRMRPEARSYAEARPRRTREQDEAEFLQGGLEV